MGHVKASGRLAERARIRSGRSEKTLLLPMMKEQALSEYGDDPDRDPGVIHPSEMCKPDWCIRATYYRISGRKPKAERFNFVLETIFATGNDSHEKYQRWLRGTGKLYGSWECLACRSWWAGLSGDLPIGCQEGDLPGGCPAHVWAYREVRMRQPHVEVAPIVGRADGAIDNALAEVKTIGMGTLRIEAPDTLNRYYVKHGDKGLYDLDRLWKDLRRPFTGHVKQASIYLWLARERGLPFTQMNFIYEFKANQQTKEFVLMLSEDVIKPMLERARTIQVHVLVGVPPDCEFGGCKQCRAYETEEYDDGTKEAPGAASEARGVVRGSSSEAERPVPPASGEAQGNPSAGPARRADGPVRPGADEPDGRAEPVGGVFGGTAGGGSGRRVVHRKTGRQDRRPVEGAEQG